MKDRVNTLDEDISVIKEYTINRLLKRNVSIDDIASVACDYLVYNKKLNVTLTECIDTLLDILNKREILHKIILGIDIDEIAEKNLIQSPIMDVIKGDDGLFGVDELFGINISDLYGAIGYSTFGYFDKIKPGIIDKLDTSKDNVNTFLDDLVCGLAAATSSKLLHKYMETANLNALKTTVISQLNELNIKLKDIAEIVYNEQKKYNSDLNFSLCEDFVESVISKREVLNKLIPCLFLNNSQDHLNKYSQFIDSDFKFQEGLFGLNKSLGLSISELYGAIGYSNYGYFCETAPGIISKVKNDENISMFIVDAVCGITAATSGKIAHYYRGNKF